MALTNRTSSRERDFGFTLTRADGDGRTFEGTAAVFNTPARIRDSQGEYDEVIAPTAFNKAMRDGRKPIFMFNHGKHPVWADMPIGTITDWHADNHALHVQARMLGHDFFAPIREAIAAKAIPGMSFRFDPSKGKDSWTDRGRGKPPLCTRTELNCPELGPVISPAYVETTASVRSICTALEKSFPGAVDLRSSGTVEGIQIDDDETDKQSLLEDAIAQLWGFDDSGAFNWVEMHDDHMIFGVNDAYVSDHRGLWQVNYSYDNGTLTMEPPVQVQATGFVPLVQMTDNPPGNVDEPNVPVDFNAPTVVGPRSVVIVGSTRADKYNTAELAALQKAGKTFPGGTSYPINDAEDLANAIKAVGMGNADHDKIRAYIIKRAKAMNMDKQIPDNWNSDGSLSNQNSTDLGTLNEAGMATSGEAATQARTGPLTMAERRQYVRQMQLDRRHITRKVAS